MDFSSLVFDFDMVALGALLTFLTILFTFYNQVAVPLYMKTLKPVAQFLRAVAESPVRISNLDKKLDLILGELTPNGGASLKDQLNRLESSVAISDSQRKLLLDSIVNGIFVSNAEGECTWVNETLLKRIHGKEHDLLGNNWISSVHPTDRKMVVDEWEEAVKGGRSFNLHFKMIDLKSETPINVHCVATPAKSFDDTVVGYNGVIYFNS